VFRDLERRHLQLQESARSTEAKLILQAEDLKQARDNANRMATDLSNELTGLRDKLATAEQRAARAEGYAEALIAQLYPAPPSLERVEFDQYGNRIYRRF
jgi:hypothetical protein